MRGNDERLIQVLEEVMSAGTRRGLEVAELGALWAGGAVDPPPEIVEVLEGIREGRRPPEALLAALGAVRSRLVAELEPPVLRRGLGAVEREARLSELCAASGAPPPVEKVEGSLLEQLAPLPAPAVAEPIEKSSELLQLWSLVRTGRIAERRAAVRRLGALMQAGELQGEALDDRQLVAALTELRDPRIAFEVDLVLASVQGSAGRGARHRLARADRLLARVEDSARTYWAGDTDADPLRQLTREEWLRLGVWLRRGSDALASHLSEHLRALLGSPDPSELAEAVGALVSCGDDRLVPVLTRILPDGPLAARIATARALARIPDPRVHTALAKAYRHAEDELEKTVLSGALGQYGDPRALPFLLERLEDAEPAMLEETVRSIGDVGDETVADGLLPLLESERPTVVRAAALALARCGGTSALERLEELARARHPDAGVLAEAAECVVLRLRASGVLQPDDHVPRPIAMARVDRGRDKERRAEAEQPPEPWVRLRAAGLFLWGILLARLRLRERALGAFAAAARLDPTSPIPHLREAMVRVSRRQDELAIVAFRRALEADRGWVLSRTRWVERLGAAYLRRADGLVARRRRREALSLLDEVAALDLRKADIDQRLAIARRRDRLLVERTGRRSKRP